MLVTIEMNPSVMQIIAIVVKPIIPSIQPTIATIVIHMNTIHMVSIVLILITIPPNILFLIIGLVIFASYFFALFFESLLDR